MTPLDQRITALEQKIQTIDAERAKLLQELTRLKQHPLSAVVIQTTTLATATHQSPIKDKINLFRALKMSKKRKVGYKSLRYRHID